MRLSALGGYNYGMCGRYTLRRPGLLRKLSYQSEFDEFSELKIQPRFSVAPTQPVPVIRRVNGDAPRVAMLRWGLIPYWTRGKPKHEPFNARSETVATSGMFREPFERRRCLMVCDGFYEPKGKKQPRQAYFFRRPDDEPFALAGIWDSWRPDKDAEPVETCTMLTTSPSGFMRPIHDRMPVVLQPRDYDRWLDADVAGDGVADLLRPAPDDFLDTWPVLDMVANPETNHGFRPGAAER